MVQWLLLLVVMVEQLVLLHRFQELSHDIQAFLQLLHPSEVSDTEHNSYYLGER